MRKARYGEPRLFGREMADQSRIAAVDGTVKDRTSSWGRPLIQKAEGLPDILEFDDAVAVPYADRLYELQSLHCLLPDAT